MKTDADNVYNRVISRLLELIDCVKCETLLRDTENTGDLGTKNLINIVARRLTQGDITFIPPDFLMQSNFFNHDKDAEKENQLCQEIDVQTNIVYRSKHQFDSTYQDYQQYSRILNKSAKLVACQVRDLLCVQYVQDEQKRKKILSK